VSHVRAGSELEGPFVGLMSVIAVGVVPEGVIARAVDLAGARHLFVDWPASEAACPWPRWAAWTPRLSVTVEVKHRGHLVGYRPGPGLALLWRPDADLTSLLLAADGVKLETGGAFDVYWSPLAWHHVEPAAYDKDEELWRDGQWRV
jgi:hypothetical protein